MEEQSLVLKFDGVSTAEAGRLARELEAELRDASSDVTVNRRPEGAGHQDFGATLVLIFGTGAAIALAERLGDWLKLHRSVSLTIETANGKAVMTNITSKEATKLSQAFLETGRQGSR